MAQADSTIAHPLRESTPCGTLFYTVRTITRVCSLVSLTVGATPGPTSTQKKKQEPLLELRSGTLEVNRSRPRIAPGAAALGEGCVEKGFLQHSSSSGGRGVSRYIIFIVICMRPHNDVMITSLPLASRWLRKLFSYCCCCLHPHRAWQAICRCRYRDGRFGSWNALR